MSSKTWSQGRRAFYLGLCEEAMGEGSAKTWYQQAQLAGFAGTTPGDLAYLDTLVSREHGTARSWNGLSLWSVLMPTAVVAADQNRLAEVATYVNQSRQKYEAEKTPENQIRLATWLLMFSELAVESPESSLWSRSLDAFSEGREHLAMVQAEIDKTPALEERLAENPAVAMRLDAARVRKEKIEKRQQLARHQERERLQQLRALTLAYRDVTQQVVLANYHFALETYAPARTASQEAMQRMAKVFELAGQRRDYYLFSDEPSLQEIAEEKLVAAPVAPVASDAIAGIKALQATIAYRLSVKAPSEGRELLLTEATQWAKAALGDAEAATAPMPAGQDEKNLLASYVLGLAYEATGVRFAHQDPSSADAHRQAQPHFDEAKKWLAKAGQLLTQLPSPDVTTHSMAQDIQARTARLGSSAPFLAQANTLTIARQLQAASDELTEGALRHRSPELLLAQAETRRRAHQDAKGILASLEHAVAAGAIPENDPRWVLVHAKTVLGTVGDQLARRSERTEKPVSKSLQESLANEERLLRDASQVTPLNSPLRVQLEGFLALATASRAILGDQEGLVESRLHAGYRLARDAAAVLERCLKDERDAGRQIPLREALVASRLAMGHLSLRILPDYRDEPMLAFAAAFDAMARLPFAAGEVQFLGSPMISALAHRPSEAGTRLAREERQYRQMAMRFVEGALTLHFGQPAAAADQMVSALAAAQQTGPSQAAAPLDAAGLLAQADGVEAKADLRDSLQAFRVLSEVAAGRHETALVEVLRALVPEVVPAEAGRDFLESLDRACLAKATGRIRSPLVGYALATSLDAYCSSLDLAATDRRTLLLEQARAAQEHTKQLFASLPLRLRYPHLVTLNEDLGKRLTAPEYYLAQVSKYRARGDYGNVMRCLNDGVKRHPNSDSLWRELIAARMQQLQSTGSTPEQQRALLADLETVTKYRFIPPCLVEYCRGVVYQGMGKTSEAMACFERSQANAETPGDRVRARARAAQLKAQLAIVGA